MHLTTVRIQKRMKLFLMLMLMNGIFMAALTLIVSSLFHHLNWILLLGRSEGKRRETRRTWTKYDVPKWRQKHFADKFSYCEVVSRSPEDEGWRHNEWFFVCNRFFCLCVFNCLHEIMLVGRIYIWIRSLSHQFCSSFIFISWPDGPAAADDGNVQTHYLRNHVNHDHQCAAAGLVLCPSLAYISDFFLLWFHARFGRAQTVTFWVNRNSNHNWHMFNGFRIFPFFFFWEKLIDLEIQKKCEKGLIFQWILKNQLSRRILRSNSWPPNS